MQLLEDSNEKIEIILTALSPFQISAEIAKFQFYENGQKEMGLLFYILGYSTLYASYLFVEIDTSFFAKISMVFPSS